MTHLTPKEICIAAIVDKALLGWEFCIRHGANSSSRAYLHAVTPSRRFDQYPLAFRYFPIAMLDAPYWQFDDRLFGASEAIELIENHLHCCLCRKRRNIR